MKKVKTRKPKARRPSADGRKERIRKQTALAPHVNRYHVIVLVVAIAAAAVMSSSYYMPKYRPADTGSTDCMTASECVPAQCCHPTECVNRMVSPDCETIACTEECRSGTMDCGQGSCSCIENQCVAVIE